MNWIKSSNIHFWVVLIICVSYNLYSSYNRKDRLNELEVMHKEAMTEAFKNGWYNCYGSYKEALNNNNDSIKIFEAFKIDSLEFIKLMNY